MPTPTYPAPPFPKPSHNLAYKTVAPVARTDMDSGLTRQQARFSTSQRTFSIQLGLLQAQMETFETWFAEDLAYGTLWFELTLPTSGGFETLTVRFVGGTYDTQYKAHMNFQVSAILEQQIVQDVEVDEVPLIPKWWHPEVNLDENYDLLLTDTKKSFICDPNANGGTLIINEDSGIDFTGVEIGIRIATQGTVIFTNVPVNTAPVPKTLIDTTLVKNVAKSLACGTTDPDGDTITYSAGLVAPTHGTLTSINSSTGAVLYTPTTNYTGPDNFTIKADDGNGGVTYIVVVVTINPPVETWMDVAISLGAWGVYRADTGVTVGTGGIQQINDLSGNAHHLIDNVYSTAKRAQWTGSNTIETNIANNYSFSGIPSGGMSLAQCIIVAHHELTVFSSNSNSGAVAMYYSNSNSFGTNQTRLDVSNSGGGLKSWTAFQTSASGSSLSNLQVPTATGTKFMTEYKVVNVSSNYSSSWQVNNVILYQSIGTPQNCNRIQFGSSSDKTNQGLGTKVRGFVVFDAPSILQDPVKAERFAYMKQLMVAEFG